ncbi:response regulator transcription factor [Nocardiopsis exhalans]|uniref:Response regulator transcription factor n=1 Tax=Nocardiopsis exhalans TaxID=163604 RepID=A0ABY5D745_9ACTN|nr:response regulator transcription factor [Nocardiopsis exhalans]USY18941.1 response regulator transcription factor [Nocardiopsis exhalans]
MSQPNHGAEPVRVILVDDHRIVRRGMARLLAAEGDIEVVGEAEDGVAALELLGSPDLTEPPHVALVDVHMPRMDGTELLGHLAERHPGVAAVVLTSFDEDEHLFACLRAGAKGYLLKDAEPEEVAESVRRAARGESVLLGHAAERMIANLAGAASSGPTPEPAPAPPPSDSHGLTDREWDVVRLIGTGASNREVARTLFLSEGTVRNHVTNALRKLDLRDRTALALWFTSWESGQQR